MAYEKRVCVLKQIKKGFSADGNALSGAVYAERLGTELTITPKIAAAPLTDGRYCLAIWADGKTFCTEYKNSVKITDAPSLARGISVLLCFVRGEAEPLAYGGCGDAPQNYKTLLSAVNRDEGIKQVKRKREETELPVQTGETAAAGEEQPACFRGGYDDEAIAQADYFALSESDEDESAYARGEEEAQTHSGGSGPAEDDGVPPHPQTRGSLAYYREVKEKLEEAFSKFPRDERLKAIFPMSEWVNSEGALLGIVYEEGAPRYLCVAVEAKGAPPEEIKERGCFVPRTQFSDEEGFYVVFQDADTGEYVRVYDA